MRSRDERRCRRPNRIFTITLLHSVSASDCASNPFRESSPFALRRPRASLAFASPGPSRCPSYDPSFPNGRWPLHIPWHSAASLRRYASAAFECLSDLSQETDAEIRVETHNRRQRVGRGRSQNRSTQRCGSAPRRRVTRTIRANYGYGAHPFQHAVRVDCARSARGLPRPHFGASRGCFQELVIASSESVDFLGI